MAPSATGQPIVPNPSKSPLPLSASQEAQPFTATFMCRKQQKLMNNCMMQYATQAEQDAAREEWFATIDKRKEERDAKEAKRKEDEKFWKQWWDKDAKVPSTEGRDSKGRQIEAKK
ncbi:hypothetical protein AC578_1056 [Pseudocercospora eumusae]|uniref:COX assembly mitochondrial protein n=1 Tax=Pseudocercospora eumusae TaxID=321146 RepID=A0A139HTD8_9PEZI|nr:hypothetical protein AC578_1056 [Pseudocercospora eumusae]